MLAQTETTYIRKTYYAQLTDTHRLIAFIGSRGAGKTTLLLQLIKTTFPNALYVSGDDIVFTDTRLYMLADSFYALGGRVLVVDEVHRYPNWSQEIKNIYDGFPDMKLIISGSSMLDILYQKYDLSRRAVTVKMLPMSFREYLELRLEKPFEHYMLETLLKRGSALSRELVFEHPTLFAEFKAYLAHGAYPFFLEGTESFYEKLNNALEKVIHEDVPSINRISFDHLGILEKLIYFVATANEPFLVNIASLSRKLGISEPTLHTYLSILEKSGIFKALRKASKKISKKPNKLLFANTNILHSIDHKLFIEPKAGVIRETFFASCFTHIYYSDIGDFNIDGYIFEVGGKNKSFTQIKDQQESYLVLDIDYSTHEKKIPLWLFGFLR
jgi:predicted AAA+ superfamily ATPase